MSSEINLTDSFRQYLIADGKSPKTVASYTGDVQGFTDWLVTKGVTFDGRMTRFHVTSYRRYLMETDTAINTINKKINSLNSFNRWLIENGIADEVAVNVRKDKVKIASGSEGEVEVFSEEEVERILFHLHDTNKVIARDRAIVTLLLYTGVRVSELVGIKIRDMDFLTLQLKVLGKGGKAREIPLKADVAEAVKEYINTERKDSRFATSEYLLLSQRAGRLDRDTVSKVLRKMGGELGITMYPHKFRHTFCSRLVARGVPITTVSQLAGHASITTTAQFYVSTSRKDKANAVDLL